MSEKPVRPDESECCGSGCKPCIFDVYEERLRKWEAKMGNLTESKALDQIKYLPFLITHVHNVDEVLKVFNFQAVTLKNECGGKFVRIENTQSGIDFEIFNERLKIKSGEYLILKGIFESETISRSYTPVLSRDSFEKGVFTVIVSLQADGKMSQFFKTLQINNIVFWRGPFLEFTKDLNSFRHILLFGGGTGIVPLYNIAKNIVEDEESEVWVNVFASFKTVNGIILRKEFGKLSDYWNFQMSIFITNQHQSDFRPNHNESVIFQRINENVIEEGLEKCERKDEMFAIVCGPQGFNNFIVDALKKFGLHDKNIFIFW